MPVEGNTFLVLCHHEQQYICIIVSSRITIYFYLHDNIPIEIAAVASKEEIPRNLSSDSNVR
jgi:hypothetical protein